jgi:hypothetical protein
MKLDTDLFLVEMINFEEKRVLVRTDQAKTTEGKNVIVSDNLRVKMIKPRNPEARECTKEETPRMEAHI